MSQYATCVSTRDADRPRSQSRVAVFRGLRGIGDFLVVVPSLRLLRRSLPESTIGLIAPEEVCPLASRFITLIDEFVPFPGWPGLTEGEQEVGPGEGNGWSDLALPLGAEPTLSAWGEMGGWFGCDALIQMHGDGTVSNGFCQELKPCTLVAYGPVDPSQPAVTSVYPLGLREVERCLRLAEETVRLLGREPMADDMSLEFPVTAADRAEAAAVLAEHHLLGGDEPEPYFVLHPGAKRSETRWPLERFGVVGRALSEFGRVVVTGSASEAFLAGQVASLVGPQAASVAGLLSVGGLAALLAGSRGAVTNDTGVAHLADAVGARSVVVFVGSDPDRWAPLDEALHAAVVQPARDRASAILTPEGMRLEAPSVSSVLGAAESVGIIY